MIISRTPLRISFVGGGSDLPSYFSKQRGAVVSTAINKYIYITVNKKFDNKIRVGYSKTEIVEKASDVQHELVRACLRRVGIQGGIEITSISDIPSEGSGLGSSSTYVVGLLNALYAYIEKYVSAEKIAREACEIEIDILKKKIGKQDQYIAAYGGFQHIQFYPDESVAVNPIICTSKLKRDLEQHLLLMYTGLPNCTKIILPEQSKNLSDDRNTQKRMKKMVALTLKLVNNLNKNNIRNFGRTLDANWKLKKRIASGISTHEIDDWYKIAKKAGAVGGKILGAGGGGFMLFFVSPECREAVIEALPQLTAIDFRFEPQGSKIIFIGE
jgi:D-glycero-alpha-D-manno-heptose-7-phosphate kinase